MLTREIDPYSSPSCFTLARFSSVGSFANLLVALRISSSLSTADAIAGATIWRNGRNLGEKSSNGSGRNAFSAKLSMDAFNVSLRALPSLPFTSSSTSFAAPRSVRSTKTPLTEPLSTAPRRAFETWSISRPMAAISTFATDVPGFFEIASSRLASGDSSFFIASIAASLSCIASAFCGRSL